MSLGFILPLLLVVIFIAVGATLYTEGMFGNAIRLINVVTAAFLATNFFEPLAGWLDNWQPSYTYFWDFLALWGLFGLSMIILRVVTDSICRVKVRFLKIAEQIGSAVFAVLVGWVMVCFTLFSLHTAPLAENFLFGGFQPEKRMLMGLAPDRAWMSFMRSVSKTAFSRTDPNAFDPHDQFREKYKNRRAELQSHAEGTGSLRK